MAAARAVLLERGAVGLRVKDVAERAQLAPSSVLYYYPDIAELLLDLARSAMGRYAEQRSAAVREVEGAVPRLRLAIELGVPSGPDDEESRVLYEIDALTGASQAFRVLSSAFFDRQVALYETLIESGAASGDLRPVTDPATIARGLVAMEDGLGLQVVLGHSGLDQSAARRILLTQASTMLGVSLV